MRLRGRLGHFGATAAGAASTVPFLFLNTMFCDQMFGSDYLARGRFLAPSKGSSSSCRSFDLTLSIR